MPDARRSFSMSRGRNTTARQFSGRTKSMGTPRGASVADALRLSTGIAAPTRPLRESDDKRISAAGRDDVGYYSTTR